MNGHSESECTENGYDKKPLKDFNLAGAMAGVPAPLSSLPRIPKKKRDDADIKSPTKTHRIKKEEDDEMSNGKAIKGEEMDSEEEHRKIKEEDTDEEYLRKEKKKESKKKKSRR